MDCESVFTGKNIEFLATKFNGRCYYIKFLEDLSEDERTKIKKKINMIYTIFDHSKGNLSNTEKVKALKGFSCDGCKEFKIGQVRISFIHVNNNVFLLDIFKKKQNKWSKKQKQRTEKLCTQVQEI